jgi:hypothetical protein
VLLGTDRIRRARVATRKIFVKGSVIRWTRWGSLSTPAVKLGAELGRARLLFDVKLDVDMAGYIIPKIAFPEGSSVIDDIDRMIATVIKVLGEFDPGA